MVRYLVLGGLGFVGWNWASAQPTSSTFRKTVDQVRGWFKPNAAAPRPPSHDSPTPPSSPQPPPVGSTPPVVPHGIWTGPGGVVVPPPDPIPSNQGMLPTRLVDLGGFPLVLDPNISTLRQDPDLGGTNVYNAGDLVIDSMDGTQYQLVGGRGGPFLAGPDGSLPAVDAFRV